jgi:hypothetical protein
MSRLLLALAVAAFAVATLAATGGAETAPGQGPTIEEEPFPKQTWGEGRRNPTPAQSGIYDFKDFNFGTGITECPQARLKKVFGEPFDRREKDRAEVYSDGGDDRRTNEEYSCFPQNETSIDTNPAHGQEKNIVSGINDYRLGGTGASGFGASNDNGQTWYSGIIPFPTINPAGTSQGWLISGGDPAVVFDRAGVVYYAQIAFNRDDDTNGITVQRSTNGGYTWTRACIVHILAPATTLPGACGGPGDPRLPGDGMVSFQHDTDRLANGSVPFDDKEYIAAGPRPYNTATPDPNDRIPAVCYNAGHVVTACGGRPISPDRIYVTWTKFTASGSTIMESHSDDQGRSWSPQQVINGSASFCVFAAVAGNCDDNQFSTPIVHPDTGIVHVTFENFNTPDENQYLHVRSTDGGQTWSEPHFITPVFDINYPRSGASNRQDCSARGQQFGRIVYTNSCFRSNSGGNVTIDHRGGAFADDLYLVMADNRNGTVFSSNSDVFLFKSTDGGSTWIGPTRVNNDPSELTAGNVSITVDPPGDPPPITFNTGGRDCGRPEGTIGFGALPPALFEACIGEFGADQWWPWVDINDFGHLNIVFHDRRLDVDSTAGEWPASRAVPAGRPGNYLVWTWGAQCEVKRADSRECLAPGAVAIPQPTGPVNPGADPVPGQGAAFLGTLHNFGIQDVPSNFDYCFRAGIFCGDYNNVAVTPNDTKVYAYWTDARNGRSAGGPTSPQAGRNPSCEQADGMMDEYSSLSADAGQKLPREEDAMFLVTPCPADATRP